ncbi:substrate-binding domain-containing protein [Georgenia sp. TF02-10]|uniref:substrate-binding domain-containing protein n=1 Tax=Georgenia sp. TF02-10 TaxID=2917725 RepID=UPI001FA7E431|nr:substrate-binding domain-containing protein [Georgenia sp. TF02-10]UNX54834.1 substrate-binding domain-containing protein [Georgenia sp. TF02-10]
MSLVVDDIGNPAYIEVMRALQALAREHGFRLLVESTNGRIDEELRVVESLRQRYVDGLVMTSTRFPPRLVEALRAPAVPVVVIGSVPDRFAGDSVGADAVGGARTATEHLIEEGCERLAMVNGPEGTLPARSRAGGFRAGLAARGLDAPVIRHAAEFTREAGYETTVRLLAEHDLDGIVCANDQLAIGALHACEEAGRRVPEDIALVGMDNSRDTTVCRPQLTSLDLRFADRGRLAGQMLLDRIQGRYTGAPRRQQVYTELVVRGSSRRGRRQ